MRLLQLGSNATDVASDPQLLRAAAEHFSQRNWLRLPQLLEPSLLRMVQEDVAGHAFEHRAFDEVELGAEDYLGDGRAFHLLGFLLNDPAVFRVLEAVTGCGSIGNFVGRFYRLEPTQRHGHSWHDDIGSTRLLALSVNVGTKPYEGANLALRTVSTGSEEEVPNLVPGDAILFRIGEGLEHRTTPIRGDAAKTAYAGWFRREPSFAAMLLGRA